MQEARSKSAKTFHVTRDPKLIENKPLNFAAYAEYSESLTEQDLVNYIIKEAQHFRNDRSHDVGAQSSHLDTRFAKMTSSWLFKIFEFSLTLLSSCSTVARDAD